MTNHGFYRITCTAHYKPIAHGPFDTQSEAEDFARQNRVDYAVFNPPPFAVETFGTLRQAIVAAGKLANAYSQEELP